MENSSILPEQFFLRDVKVVAKDLLGKTLCVRPKKGDLNRAIISETEAYDGEEDLACHASKGKTPRTKVMYKQGGVCYVYLCYGMHWMLNFVTGMAEYPAAVLIRGTLQVNGPGRLTKNLQVDGSFNGMRLGAESLIWLEDGGVNPHEVFTGPRVGVNYAGPIWAEKPYRFWFSNH